MRVGEETQSVSGFQDRPLIRPSVRTGAPDPIPSGLRPSPLDKGSRPPVGGRLGVRSNREEFGPLWDVWIHILGIRAECACWKAGGPVCRPYGGNVVSPGGAPCRVVCGRRAGGDTRPYGRVWAKTTGAQCAPLQERVRETAPSSAPVGGLRRMGRNMVKFSIMSLFAMFFLKIPRKLGKT